MAIFCGDIALHRPYIGLIYGRYLQFRFPKWSLTWGWDVVAYAMENPNYKWRFSSLGKSSISMGRGFHGYVKWPEGKCGDDVVTYLSMLMINMFGYSKTCWAQATIGESGELTRIITWIHLRRIFEQTPCLMIYNDLPPGPQLDYCIGNPESLGNIHNNLKRYS